MAFLRGRLADDAEAKDLLQEVFIRVHYHLCWLPPAENQIS
jgi:DNA-directed RNA polymerase specialized sigma24 family protein